MHRAGTALRVSRLLPGMLQRALRGAIAHDCLNLGQSAAYSAMVSLFPALIVSAAAIALLPDTAPVRSELGGFFGQVLPADVFPLLTSYFTSTPGRAHTARTLLLAAVVSLTGASSVLATLMEGLARANDLPSHCWTFVQRRTRAFLLVPLSLLPLAVATVLVVFGQLLTVWLTALLATAIQPVFFAAALVVRWTVALSGVVAVTAIVYHLGSPLRDRWQRTLPGAIAATAAWFITTLAFGWYVTRFANYAQVYGSLGAGIALLFWLYIVFLSILFGAEVNAQFRQHVFSAELSERRQTGHDQTSGHAAETLPVAAAAKAESAG